MTRQLAFSRGPRLAFLGIKAVARSTREQRRTTVRHRSIGDRDAYKITSSAQVVAHRKAALERERETGGKFKLISVRYISKKFSRRAVYHVRSHTASRMYVYATPVFREGRIRIAIFEALVRAFLSLSRRINAKGYTSKFGYTARV